MSRNGAELILREVARAGTENVGIAHAALAFARLERDGIDHEPYEEHISALATDVAQLLRGRAASIQHATDVLNAVMFDAYGYIGDMDTYDDLENADLMRVIDRRRGLPVALSILYMHIARIAGLRACGLSFPGHFLLRLDLGGERAVIDPFNGGVQMQAGSMRRLLKSTLGREMELTPDMYQPVDDVEVLLRLQNNVKHRLIEQDRMTEAAVVLDRMRMIAPDARDLMREAGLLHTHAGNLKAAIHALEDFLDSERLPGPRRDATILLQRLRSCLN